jgi:predicted RND superfamily exporter protein/lauroyl/myristoyl acyltransferase
VSRLWKQWWWLLPAALAALGFARLRFDADVLDLLPADIPGVQGLKAYQEHFSNARELIVSVRAPSANDAEQRAGELAACLRARTNLVSDATWQPAWTEHPAQAAELIAYLWFNQPPAVFQNLTNRLAAGPLDATLEEARQTLAVSLSPLDIARRSFDPFDLLNLPGTASQTAMRGMQGGEMFASPDGTFRLIYIRAQGDLSTWRDCANWLAAIKSEIAQLRAGKPEWDKVVVHATGRPAFVAEIAGGMRRDMTASVLGTALIIAALFWLSHRRWLPMLWLLTLLALILAATMGVGGLILGTINVVSLGFAAVLLGLAVDYAVVHYQEALAHPSLTVPEIRRAIAPSILWAALTTIVAFLALNFGGLPGLAQLGSLVAIGVALAAIVMVVSFLPPLFPHRRASAQPAPPAAWKSFFVPPPPAPAARPAARTALSRILSWATVGGAGLAIACLVTHPPRMDRSGDALRIQNTEAELALNEIAEATGLPQDPIWVIAHGGDPGVVGKNLAKAVDLLESARSNQSIKSYLVPAALWPNPEFQIQNRAAARWTAGQQAGLNDAARRAGFNTNALALSDEILGDWKQFAAATNAVWPANDLSRWLFERFTARGSNAWFALGLAYPSTNAAAAGALAVLSKRFAQDGIYFSSWNLLSAEILDRVSLRLRLVVAAMAGLVLLSLWLAFGNFTEVCLGAGVMLASGLCLLLVMNLAGWSWNLLNLMGIPLILGTGVDYSIFMQLGLRRAGGDIALVRRSIGRALLLCGGTAVAGFGSLAWSGNLGMASLGKVCAVGIAANVLIATCLLPYWWLGLARRGARKTLPTAGLPATAAPSTLYRAGVWRAALLLTRILPSFVLRGVSIALAEVYQTLNRERRDIVVENLLPAVQGDRKLAQKTARKLFREFSLKLLDLWKFEIGILAPIEARNEKVYQQLAEIHRQGRGALVVTPHLGNWEIGGQLLKSRGLPLLAITQGEPGAGFTELRSASRARWGIETLAIGQDAFAFVEVIRRLQEGAVIALLIDRPSPQSAVIVDLFGQPFPASVAAAELARASGCAIFCATIVRSGDRYLSNLLTEVVYDRRELGSREARRALTARIMKIFEPEIRQHPEQWFHFVPLWPKPRDISKKP